MTRYLIRRLLLTIPVILGVATLVFALIHLVPGDPAQAMLGETAPQADVLKLRHALGLDQPLLTQYRTFMTGLLRGDLGTSFRYNVPVTTQIREKLPNTATLALAAMCFAILFAIPLGILAAVFRGTFIDHAAMTLGAAYYVETSGAERDNYNWVPESSRRARGFAVWAALRSLGRDGLAVLVDRLCATASMLAKGFEEVDEVEVVNDVVFTQVMFRLSSDERTAELGRRLLADGTCVVTPAIWAGRTVQRCAVSNWSTSEADVAATVAAVRRVVAAL